MWLSIIRRVMKKTELRIKLKENRVYDFSVYNGKITDVKTIGKEKDYSLSVESYSGQGTGRCLITARRHDGGFTFMPEDANEKYPVYYKKEGVIITTAPDERTFDEIEKLIAKRKGVTDRERFESEKEMTLEEANTLEKRSCPTFLSVFGNVNLWEAGFRGFPIEEVQHEYLYDYFMPRKNWTRRKFGEDSDRVVYCYSFGRGMGAKNDLRRENFKGIYPSVIATLRDNGIKYVNQSFCDSSCLHIAEDKGSFYLNADYHSASPVFTEEQEKHVLEGEDENQTILRCRITATNENDFPAYAYFRLPHINTKIMAEFECVEQTFKKGCGFYKNKIYSVCNVNGKRADNIEFALLLLPGESCVVKFALFHTPQEASVAEQVDPENFESRLDEAECYWKKTLGDVAEWQFPEETIEKAFKTGYFHILSACYGRKGDETFAPTPGVYAPIGSESSPMIQFLDSVGATSLADYCVNYFFDKEHADGFIQNIRGYMLENGAALYTAGLHFEYTKDIRWLNRNADRIRKAALYILDWMKRNENDKATGYGMIDGQVADPEDTFRSYCLNSFACAGLNKASELLKASGKEYKDVEAAGKILLTRVRDTFHDAEVRSPLVPLKNGEWVPAVGPWAEAKGAISLHIDNDVCFTHAGHNLKDSLLSLGFLVYYGVFSPDSEEATRIIDYLTDSYFVDNTAFSQPYYNLVPLVNLSRGERKAFLKEYYTAFATLADRETCSFWEHYFLATPHKTHEQAWFLMRTREMLYLEKDGALYLLSGIPDLWRGKGKKIVLKNAHCLYGEFSLIVEFADDKIYVEFDGGFTDIPVYISINGEFKRVMQSDKHIVFSPGKECDGR